MAPLERHLRRSGYSTINVNYPSTKHSINELAEIYLANIIRNHCIDKNKKIHFVTHSMGGIIVRYYLKHHAPANLGKVVMLTPPNHGSEVADFLKNNSLFKRYYGPAGQQLITGEGNFIGQLGAVNFEIGVIAGNRTINPITYFMIPGSNDGSVSIKSTEIEGMTDHIVASHSHSFIMRRKSVWQYIDAFLANGRFIPESF